MAIQILTDSAADYEPEELTARGIISVPLQVAFDDDCFLDGVNLTKEDFFHRLLERKSFPKTSQPSPEQFLQHFQAAKERGDAVIAILLSSALSGTYQSACLAKDMVEYEHIYVIDSRTATAGQRMLVDVAEGLRDQGTSAPEIFAKIEELKSRVKIAAMIDTLEYLLRGGRMTKSQAMLGNLVNLKPVITLNKEGAIEVCNKALGKAKAYGAIQSIVEKEPFDPDYPMYFIYAHHRQNCEKLVELMGKQYPQVNPAYLYNLGPTIGTHIGDGAFGVIYITKQ